MKREESVFRETIRIPEAFLGFLMTVGGIGVVTALGLLKIQVSPFLMMGFSILSLVGVRLFSKHFSAINYRRMKEKQKKRNK